MREHSDILRSLFLAALMVTSVAAMTVAVPGAAVADESTHSVEAPGTGTTATTQGVAIPQVNDTSPAFEGRSFNVTRGDIGEIDITLAEGGNATVSVGSADAGYRAYVSISDGNGDGNVTIQWNTFRAGQGDEFTVAAENDSVENVTVDTETTGNISSVIQEGPYALDLVEGLHATGSFADQDLTSRAVIVVTQRNTSALRSWTAPESAASNINNLSDVYAALDAGTIQQDSTVATSNGDDTFVLQLEADGLEGAVTASGGLFATPSVTLNATELDPGLNSAPDVVTLNGSNTTVVTDFENGTHFLVVDTGNISEFSPGEQYRFDFTLEPDFNTEFDYGLVAPQDGEFNAEVVSTNVSFVAGEVSVDTNDDSLVTVQAADDQTVTGTSTFAAGTDVFVEAISNDDAVTPYGIPAEPVAVQSNGTWTATLDFSAEEPNEGTTFTLDVSARNASTSVKGIIRGEQTVHDLTFNDQQSSGSSVIVQNAELSDGGFVAIHVSDNGTPGEVLGASSYIPPDRGNRLTIVLDETLEENQELIAMAHLDTDGDQTFDFPDDDGPYTEDGSAVVEAAQITGLGNGTTATESTAASNN